MLLSNNRKNKQMIIRGLKIMGHNDALIALRHYVIDIAIDLETTMIRNHQELNELLFDPARNLFKKRIAKYFHASKINNEYCEYLNHELQMDSDSVSSQLSIVNLCKASNISYVKSVEAIIDIVCNQDAPVYTKIFNLQSLIVGGFSWCQTRRLSFFWVYHHKNLFYLVHDTLFLYVFYLYFTNEQNLDIAKWMQFLKKAIIISPCNSIVES